MRSPLPIEIILDGQGYILRGSESECCQCVGVTVTRTRKSGMEIWAKATSATDLGIG